MSLGFTGRADGGGQLITSGGLGVQVPNATLAGDALNRAAFNSQQSTDNTTTTGSNTLGTYTDTLNTLTLAAGKYLISWSGTLYAISSAGTGFGAISLDLRSGASTVVQRAASGYIPATGNVLSNISSSAVITVGSTTTYKLSFYAFALSGTPIITFLTTYGAIAPTVLTAVLLPN